MSMSAIGIEKTVFEPFRHRFDCLPAGATTGKCSSDGLFSASALANTV